MTDTDAKLIERTDCIFCGKLAAGNDAHVDDNGEVAHKDCAIAELVAQNREAATRLSAVIAERDAAWAEFGNVPRDKTLAAHIKAALDELAKVASDERIAREKAEADLDEMGKALEPFAAAAEFVAEHHPGWNHDKFNIGGSLGDVIAFADFRRARALLKQGETP